MLDEIASVVIIVAGMAGIAAGRIPGLKMNRAAIAMAAAAALVAVGAIPLDAALDAIDARTLVLLFSMMVVVAGARMSGAFELVAFRMAGLAGRPLAFLAAIVAVSGVLSALFLNDTMCLVLAPVVAETSLRARRNPVPYLVATATAANVGSAATIIGNPQNMLIGARSGIPFVEFLGAMALPSALGLLICWVVIALVFPGEFLPSIARRAAAAATARAAAPTPGGLGAVAIDRGLLVKSAAASAAMLAAFLAGVPVVLAAALPAAFLLASRRVEASRLLAGVDFNLLVFFGGLFVITASAGRTAAFAWLERGVLAGATGSPWLFSGATAIVSNVISNVPAVMMLSPLTAASPDPGRAWLVLAMASTFAGNLTLLGSVANLIVAEGAEGRGVRVGFWAYLKAGLPITVATIAIGAAILSR